MELYLIEIDNGMDYSDHESDFKVKVFRNQLEAEKYAKEWMEFKYSFIWKDERSYKVTELKFVDGYRIRVEG